MTEIIGNLFYALERRGRGQYNVVFLRSKPRTAITEKNYNNFKQKKKTVPELPSASFAYAN